MSGMVRVSCPACRQVMQVHGTNLNSEWCCASCNHRFIPVDHLAAKRGDDMPGQFDFDDDAPRRRSRRDDEPQRIYIENRPRSAFGAGFGGCLGVGCAIVVVVGGLIAAGVYFASKGGKHGGLSQADEYSGPIESSISEEKRKAICAEFGGWHRVAYDKCEVEFRGVSMENGHVKDRYNQILGTGIASICKEHRVSIDQLLNITKEGRAKKWWSDPSKQ